MQGERYNWNLIRADYADGGISLRELAKKYGVSKGAIEKRCRNEHWCQKIKESKEKVVKEVIKKREKQRISTLESFTNATDMVVKALEERASQITPDTDIRDIRTLTSAMRDIKELRVFLTLDDKRETDARIAKLEKEAKEETDADKTMTIVVEGMGDICN